jgi:hypothetical protein
MDDPNFRGFPLGKRSYSQRASDLLGGVHRFYVFVLVVVGGLWLVVFVIKMIAWLWHRFHG